MNKNIDTLGFIKIKNTCSVENTLKVWKGKSQAGGGVQKAVGIIPWGRVGGKDE